MKKELVCFKKIPIYPATLEFCVTGDMVNSQKKKRRIDRYGNGPIKNYRGLVWFNHTAAVALMISRDSLTHEVINHEIYHATHRIAEFAGVKHSFDNDEPFAYLCGYISEFVYGKLKQWGLRVK